MLHTAMSSDQILILLDIIVQAQPWAVSDDSGGEAHSIDPTTVRVSVVAVTGLMTLIAYQKLNNRHATLPV